MQRGVLWGLHARVWGAGGAKQWCTLIGSIPLLMRFAFTRGQPKPRPPAPAPAQRRPLLGDAVSEDQRAAAMWSAPFILLVLDDSSQQQLEYSNAAASELFGRGYLDLFGVAGHELVAQDADSQVGAWGQGRAGRVAPAMTHACGTE
jgi:hypothetical protein